MSFNIKVDPTGHTLRKSINLFMLKNDYFSRYFNFDLSNLAYERQRLRKHKNITSRLSLSFVR